MLDGALSPSVAKPTDRAMVKTVDRDLQSAKEVAWNALTIAVASIGHALNALSQKKGGAKLGSKSSLKAQLFLLAGDVALHQHRLIAAASGGPDIGKDELMARAFHSYEEAERGATDASDEDMMTEARIKKLLVESGGNPSLSTFAGLDLVTVNSVVQDMADQGLIEMAVKL